MSGAYLQVCSSVLVFRVRTLPWKDVGNWPFLRQHHVTTTITINLDFPVSLNFKHPTKV